MRLILVLQSLPAAFALPSRVGDGSISGEIAFLYGRLASGKTAIKRTTQLLKLVIARAKDVDLWAAVFDLIASTQTATPPTTYQNTLLDTPFRPSSAEQRGSEQTRDEVDQRILEELQGRVYDNVTGIYERFFESQNWMDAAGQFYDTSRTLYTDGRWDNWPEPSLQESFFNWFWNFQETVLSGLHRTYYTSANKLLLGSEAGRKLDIFLAPADSALSNDSHGWSNVLVIGEHKFNRDEDGLTSTLIQLAGYAREVLGSQPGRRFVHGFTICGSLMRL